jgi:hypothetical protein
MILLEQLVGAAHDPASGVTGRGRPSDRRFCSPQATVASSSRPSTLSGHMRSRHPRRPAGRNLADERMRHTPRLPRRRAHRHAATRHQDQSARSALPDRGLDSGIPHLSVHRADPSQAAGRNRPSITGRRRRSRWSALRPSACSPAEGTNLCTAEQLEGEP